MDLGSDKGKKKCIEKFGAETSRKAVTSNSEMEMR
jgi:hypothetical protein